MKKVLFVLLLLLVTKIQAQEESALDKVARETCEYFEGRDEEFKTMSANEIIGEFGIKMVELYLENKDAFDKEGLIFDLSKGASEGERLGEMVGLKMVTYCPSFLMVLASNEEVQEIIDEPDAPVRVMTSGKIKKLYGDEINFLEVKGNDGKTQKFVWLTNFEGSDELLSVYDNVKGKKVNVTYENIEFFSPKLKEYITRKKITKIEFLE